MPVFRKDGTNILFIHVPKCGGSTVENAFRNSGYEVQYLERSSKKTSMNYVRTCSPQHMHAALLHGLFRIDRFDLVFMTVRHPIARFRSEYVYDVKNKPTVSAAAADVSAWAETKFAKYAKDPYVLDNHLRPQHEFWIPQATIYRLEDGLGAMLADLNERHELGVRAVPRALHSEKAVGFSSSAVELSSELTTQLTEFYADDFERFGYEPDVIPRPAVEPEPVPASMVPAPPVKKTSRVVRKARAVARALKS